MAQEKSISMAGPSSFSDDHSFTSLAKCGVEYTVRIGKHV